MLQPSDTVGCTIQADSTTKEISTTKTTASCEETYQMSSKLLKGDPS